MHIIGVSSQICWFTDFKIIVNLSRQFLKKKGRQPFMNW